MSDVVDHSVYIHICKNGIFEIYLHTRTLKRKNTHSRNVELVRDYCGRFMLVFQFINVCHAKIMHSASVREVLERRPIITQPTGGSLLADCQSPALNRE